ncbi:DUF3859 domain-containing protein [Loktanella sp. D2R18]|uniref:DUF3859 domain-containing protein n=1 Tax=Rhodobacterales TaxID=204455 RepID=UPI000DE95651|nr:MULTISPECIES: DUF3859 domain-containing protein [Rhodobacterales]MDO6591334.1 DUF3859 domain-containing protein [Yoonia sp. 1_MG-2023]RBW46283.1 DUF3859 domain-containing protein [Loktanella sp. D2R18]
MKHWLTIFCLIIAPKVAAAQADMVSTEIAEIEIGILCAPDTITTSPAPDTLAGITHVVDEPPNFVSNGQVVPAAFGVGFGVRSRALRAEGLDNVTIVITHPPMGDNGATTQSYTTGIGGDGGSFTFYQFDYAYELQTGPWTITAMRNDKPLYTVSFDVVAPENRPDLASVCGYVDMLS